MLRRLAIVARENNKPFSGYFNEDDPYVNFCLDELGLYLYNKAGEKTEREKIIEQNRGLVAKGKKKE